MLEIGAGGGRWSEPLLERAGALTLVDVTPHVLDVLGERFGADPRVTLVRSGGADLPGVPDRSIDVVWSFDVFVHVAPLDQAGYLAEIARVLRPGGLRSSTTPTAAIGGASRAAAAGGRR